MIFYRAVFLRKNVSCETKKQMFYYYEGWKPLAITNVTEFFA